MTKQTILHQILEAEKGMHTLSSHLPSVLLLHSSVPAKPTEEGRGGGLG